MPSAPPDAAIRRFAHDLTSLIGQPKNSLGLAVSGGPDSVALLLLTHASGFPCGAATVDHGLRPESRAEAEMVSALCKELGVPHQILTVGSPDGGNLSDWARKVRYAALADWMKANGHSHVLTAHHADDQLETVIMRLNRSSGVAGLAGIRARRGNIARPLLKWRKSELVELVQGCDVEAINDPTNIDGRFDRARLRLKLANTDWLDPVAAAHSAQALSDADKALDWAAHDCARSRLEERDGTWTLDPAGLPKELVRRIVLLSLLNVQSDLKPRGEALERLVSALERGAAVMLGNVKCTGGIVWRFSPAPPRGSARRTA